MITVGMATYDDWSGVYFTVQALRMYHPEVSEIVIIDNEGDKQLEDWAKYWGKGIVKYVSMTDPVGTSAPRSKVFEVATNEIVFCVDCHVLISPGAFKYPFPEGLDLWHGAMCYDDFNAGYVVDMKDQWNCNMWGVWGNIVNEEKLPDEPFEIKMHGLGFFGCRKEAWLGFNPDFRGFGGEEGYIHEKFRKNGRKVLCLPWIKWCHRFGKSGSYRLDVNDRIRNYLIGFKELGMDPKPVYQHFGIRVVDHVARTIG